MARFNADASFHFEAESVEVAGPDMLRLKEAAARAGFQLVRAKVTPAPPDDEKEGWAGTEGWTSYVPLDPET
jgi:hypothetical protein